VHQQPAEAQPASKVAETANMDLKADRAAGSRSDAHAKSREAEKKMAGGIGIGSGSGIGGGGFGGGVYKVDEGQKAANNDAIAKMQEKKEVGPAEPAKAAPSRELAYSAPALSANDTFYTSTPVNRPAQGSVQSGIAQSAAQPAPAVDGERARAEEQGKSGNEISKDKRADAGTAASSESVEVNSQAQTNAAVPAAPAALKTKSSSADLGALSRANARTPRMWRLQSGKIESSDDGGKAWQERRPAKDFQAMDVAAVGQQVWAGGKAGALFLSRDNGQTWSKVSLTGDDIIALGDVTEIKISGPQTVDIMLSTGDDWQTSDGGKSFRLLPRKP
jgi:hypothetical protein